MSDGIQSNRIELKKIFSERLTILLEKCKAEGKTEKEICQELNISPSKLYALKKGKTSPRLKTCILIADYFNVSLDYLFAIDKKT